LVTCELTTPLLYWPIGGTSNCIFFLLSFIKPKYLPQNCCIWMSQKPLPSQHSWSFSFVIIHFQCKKIREGEDARRGTDTGGIDEWIRIIQRSKRYYLQQYVFQNLPKWTYTDITSMTLKDTLNKILASAFALLKYMNLLRKNELETVNSPVVLMYLHSI